MSANLVVDLYNTTQMALSIGGNIQSGGPPSAASGAVIGASVDMINANTACNLTIQGIICSGITKVQVQTSDTDTSGTYTDPTSGLAAFPSVFQSGGVVWLNSGLDGGVFGPVTSGQQAFSGFSAAAYFQRPGRFVRANVLSGCFGAVQVGFVSQLKTTGSGGGFTLAPTSGVVNV